MKTTSQIIIVFTFMIVTGTNTLAQSNDAKIIEQILKLEAEYTDAAKRNAGKPDPAGFERIHTADYVVTSRLPSKTSTLTELVALRKDPNVRRGTIDSLVTSDLKVRVYGGDAAIVTGAWKRVSKDADGKDTSASGRLTRFWVLQNGKWLLAGAHLSPDVDLEKLRAGQPRAEAVKH